MSNQTELDDIGRVPRCATCGSERVVRDARACFNPASGMWELEGLLDETHCHQCEQKTTLQWSDAGALPQARIRELNDQFRRGGQGKGTVLVTTGVQDLGSEFIMRVLAAIRSYADFSDDNDPWGEHDFGATEIDDQKVFFKIDYFSDDTMEYGSENPANADKTYRVMTIMLAGEY